MKAKFFLILLFLVSPLTNCKKEETFTNYKFTDKPAVIACENLNSKLYNEALYSFEEDILNFYGRGGTNLLVAYSQFVTLSVNNKISFDVLVSDHTLKVFEALKNVDELWDHKNLNSHFNYNGTLMDCISKNIDDKDLKTTLNALLSTSSMSPKLFGAPLKPRYNLALKDKYLASYIAFDLFYSRLFDADFSQREEKRAKIKELQNKEKPKVDFNITK